MSQIPAEKNQTLEQKHKKLESQYDFLNEKIERLKNAYENESSEIDRFKLETEIEHARSIQEEIKTEMQKLAESVIEDEIDTGAYPPKVSAAGSQNRAIPNIWLRLKSRAKSAIDSLLTKGSSKSRPIAPKKHGHLAKKPEELQSQYDLLNEEIKRFRRAYETELNEKHRFHLLARIDEAEKDLEKIKRELDVGKK